MQTAVPASASRCLDIRSTWTLAPFQTRVRLGLEVSDWGMMKGAVLLAYFEERHCTGWLLIQEAGV